MIHESIITTLNQDGSVHIAPMGIKEQDGLIIIAPFKPSTTLENLVRHGLAVVNFTDDVRIFAGCITGRYNWPTIAASKIEAMRLRDTLSHVELKVARYEDDNLRPLFYCDVVNQENHKPFSGFNRAQAAVLELAILVSRLDMLPAGKLEDEIKYLEIAMQKTAGLNEQMAWDWLMERVKDHRQKHAAAGNQA